MERKPCEVHGDKKTIAAKDTALLPAEDAARLPADDATDAGKKSDEIPAEKKLLGKINTKKVEFVLIKPPVEHESSEKPDNKEGKDAA